MSVGGARVPSCYVALHTGYWKTLVFVARPFAVHHLTISVEVRRASDETKMYGEESLADYLV
jgi:hypothetical protein